MPDTVALQVPGGLRLEVLARGATVHRLLVPTPSGERNVVLGYRTIEDYAAGTTFFDTSTAANATIVKDLTVPDVATSTFLNSVWKHDAHALRRSKYRAPQFVHSLATR